MKIKRLLEAHMVIIVKIEHSMFMFSDEKMLNELKNYWNRNLDVDSSIRK